MRGGVLLVGLTMGALLAGLGATVGASALPGSWTAALGGPAGAETPAPTFTPAARVTAAPAPPPALAAPPPATTTPAATPTAPPTTTAPVGTTTPVPATTTRAAVRTTAQRPAPAPAAAPAGTPAAQVVALTNAQRARAGCGALQVDARVTAAAQQHSADMASNNYFSHTGSDGSSFGDRLQAEGYPAPGAENIAQGQPDAAAVVDAWMNSPGHRANILDCSLTTIGVGYDSRGDYWTQDFGR
nr:CAP domain-containing protein [Pseudonocardia acidicola]